jgi:hypothetical protein
MDKLKAHINSMTTLEQFFFAHRCGTTIGYIRKRISIGGRFGQKIAAAIDRETGGKVPLAEIGPIEDEARPRSKRQRAA